MISASTFWFLAVGASAALTHILVFRLVESHMVAELANALGFGVGFFVSFSGHRWLSFKDTSTSLGTSLLRFGISALAGFVTNELIFMLLLRGLKLPALLALLAALVFAAGQTFVLGRFWAFRR